MKNKIFVLVIAMMVGSVPPACKPQKVQQSPTAMVPTESTNTAADPGTKVLSSTLTASPTLGVSPEPTVSPTTRRRPQPTITAPPAMLEPPPFLALLILGVTRSISLGAGRAQSADPERVNLSGWRWNRISPSRGSWQALREVHEGRRWSNVHEYLCFHRIRVTLYLFVMICECALCPTIYPDAAHYVDVETYTNPELNEWMLAQKLR